MAKTKRKTLESFTDPLGQEYRPGDLVAISTIASRSPRTVYGIVENIFSESTKGEPITIKQYVLNEETKRYDVVEHPDADVQVTIVARTRWGGTSGAGRKQTYTITDNITKIEV